VTDNNQDWWLAATPSVQSVTVSGGSITLPVLANRRAETIQGDPGVQLKPYLDTHIATAPADAVSSATDFTLPPALKENAPEGSAYSGGFTEAVGGGAVKPPPVKGRCKDVRKFAFRVHQPRHGRIVRVTVYVNGKRVKRVHRRRITHVTLKRRARGVFKVKIVAVSSRGTRIVSTRTYRGCKKGRPNTHVHRHRRGHGHRR
jgi:hypothetical protein